ncbi:pilus assembly protein TadG-related protein [Sphingomonas astaxanthinifaciens]|uniref:Putative Flp pilus-assembly TadG-like N-terminal domain-containing protein n=1 Tax=Sphingomonas astaxanthinifaciens DSM 22298 TaxID=1123267 RepID=A0ABQ5Z2V3_9SPHN|nr:pilus assembly protein TadG-related protein [Sphingomonas astaxanthinifaciens]GLR47099.1 hypothetical protein GCM10007925_08100 [Sphingomonas astaxanthinifaciens DSM 22298]
MIRGEEGAIAPTLALSLFGLLAIGGVAFDYARLAALDTELQSAADQAALAAATQLDGKSGACARAAAAAAGLLSNQALFANDGGGMAVKVANEAACDATDNVRFYQSWDDSTDTPGTAATSDANAKVVVLKVNPRTANFALTPVVGAISASNLTAEAVASLEGGAICKVPPLMICNPNEGSLTNANFPNSTDIGKGLLLLPGGGGTQWGPGNYGYLDFGSGANTLEKAMGANVNAEPCLAASAVNTKPGNTASATAGVNVRFDIYQNGLVNTCDRATGNCSPALNVGKDLIHSQFSTGTAPNETASNSDNCGFKTGSEPWDFDTPAYLPDPTTRAQPTALGTPRVMGMPRDICHAISTDGDCGGTSVKSKFGDGSWDRNLYFYVNHRTLYPTAPTAPNNGWQSIPSLISWANTNLAGTGRTVATVTRYDVYRWELQQMAAAAISRRSALITTIGNGKNAKDYYAYRGPACATGLAPSATVKDRRLLTAAVVNCTADNVQGSTNVKPIGWVDLFFVEPSLDRARTGKDQLYVEITGVAKRPNGDDAFQYYLRQRPRLLK